MSTLLQRRNDLPRLLRAEPVDLTLVSAWQTNTRPWTFSPACIMVHWTATASASPRNPQPTLNVVRNGWGSLPGPLYHVLVGQTGRVFLVHIQGGNHGGRGNSAAQQAAIANGRRLVWGHRPGGDNIGTSARSWGVAADHSGSGPMPAAQQQAMVRVCAAICRLEGWSANRVYHHASSTRRKVDVRGWPDLVPLVSSQLRSRTSGGSSQPAPAPAPPPPPPEEPEDMHYGQTDAKDFDNRPVILSLQRTLNRFHVDTADMPRLEQYRGKTGIEVLRDLDGGEYSAHGVQQRHLQEDGAYGDATRRAVWSAIHRSGWILGFSVRPSTGTRHDVVTQDLIAYVAQAHMRYRDKHR